MGISPSENTEEMMFYITMMILAFLSGAFAGKTLRDYVERDIRIWQLFIQVTLAIGVGLVLAIYLIEKVYGFIGDPYLAMTFGFDPHILVFTIMWMYGIWVHYIYDTYYKTRLQ